MPEKSNYVFHRFLSFGQRYLPLTKGELGRGYPEPLLRTILCGWTDHKYRILEVDPRENIEEHTQRRLWQ